MDIKLEKSVEKVVKPIAKLISHKTDISYGKSLKYSSIFFNFSKKKPNFQIYSIIM